MLECSSESFHSLACRQAGRPDSVLLKAKSRARSRSLRQGPDAESRAIRDFTRTCGASFQSSPINSCQTSPRCLGGGLPHLSPARSENRHISPGALKGTTHHHPVLRLRQISSKTTSAAHGKLSWPSSGPETPTLS